MKRLFWTALLLLFPLPAQASPFTLGNALKEKQYSLSSDFLQLGNDRGFRHRAAFGFGEGLEVGLSYLSGFPTPLMLGPSLDLEYQPLNPTWQRPMGFSIGTEYLGVSSDNPYALGNNLHMVASCDLNARLNEKFFTLATVRLGFRSDQSLRARLLGGLTIPLGDRGDVLFEALGEQKDSPTLFHCGIRLQPLEAVPGLLLEATSLGAPGAESPWDRHLSLGLSFQGSR